MKKKIKLLPQFHLEFSVILCKLWKLPKWKHQLNLIASVLNSDYQKSLCSWKEIKFKFRMLEIYVILHCLPISFSLFCILY